MWSVMYIVCYERGLNERDCNKLVWNERVCYERGLL